MIRQIAHTFLLIFISSSTIYSQGWFWQNPLPQGNFLNSVDFVSATIGWAVGEHGTILNTTNGGIKWTLQLSGGIKFLEDVSFTDTNNGTIVGVAGTILRTTNSGTTWIEQTSGTTAFLQGLLYRYK